MPKPQTHPSRTALIVEDEGLFRMEIADLLAAEGYDVLEAGNAAQALERLHGRVSLMVTDIRMPGAMDGLALAHAIADLPAGAAFVERPFQESRVVAAIRRATAR